MSIKRFLFAKFWKFFFQEHFDVIGTGMYYINNDTGDTEQRLGICIKGRALGFIPFMIDLNNGDAINRIAYLKKHEQYVLDRILAKNTMDA